MEFQGILQNRRFLVFVIVVAVVASLYLVLNIFVVGGSRGNIIINDLASVVFSVLAFVLFLNVWLSTDLSDISKGIWGQFALGLLLWAIAEIIWFYYDVILNSEIPYPSLADFFWLVGYLPIWAALRTRYTTLNVSLGLRQRRALIGLILLFILLTIIFVLVPIIVAFDPQRVIESVLNILYPLADLTLLILTSLVLFSFGQGRFVLTWGLIVTGLVFFSVSDLFYSYLSWNGYYYPDGNVNLPTLLVVTSYSLSYLLWAVGIYAYSLLLEIKYTVKLSVDSSELTKSNILVFIDAKNRIISFSDNFMLLVGAESKSQYSDRPLHEALGVDSNIMDNILQRIVKQGSISNYPLTIGAAGSNNVLLTALALINPQNKYDGAGIVIRTTLSAKDGIEPPLTLEQKGLIESFLAKAGVGIMEDAQVLKTYFLEQIRLLYSLAYEFNGQIVADSLLSFIGQKARDNDWEINVDEQHIFIPEEYQGQILIASLLKLLQEARSFTASSVSVSLVDQEMGKFDQSLKPDVLQTIDKYELRNYIPIVSQHWN